MVIPWDSVYSILVFVFGAGVVFSFTSFGTIIIEKILMYLTGAHNLVLSKDSKWKTQPDTDVIKNDVTKSKRIIFIRHGESTWNEIFNRGFGISFFFRLAKELIKEITLFPTRDSVFFDSPLNEDGIQQAKEVHEFITKGQINSVQDQVKKDYQALSGHSTSAVFVTSNLRRAIQTAAIALWGPSGKNTQKIKILSCLQEISRNVDCVALTQKQKIPIVNVHNLLKTSEQTISSRLDISENHGHKSITQNGLYRMNEFSHWAMSRPEEYIIVAGHSLYFKKYFDNYLPKISTHVARSRKMQNCAIVSFTLHEGTHNGRKMFRIDPDSIVPLYKGFM